MRSPYLLRFFSKFHIAFGAVFLVPLLVELIYEKQLGQDMLMAWLMPAAIMGSLGFYLRQKYLKDHALEDLPGLSRREGFLLVGLSWILMIAWGTVPFLLTKATPDLASAVFESASGFTTTGATVLTDFENTPRSIILWRSLSHWIGGMGIIVLSVAILPELALGGMQLFSAEASGLSGGEKLAPRIRETAGKLWFLYAILTGLETVLLMYPGGLSFFDAINNAFATTATGGFSPNGASIGGYDNGWVEAIITLFMILAGLNFSLQYKVFLNLDLKRLWRSTELRIYFLILAAATLLISLNLWWEEEAIHTTKGQAVEPGFIQALRYGGFQVVAILTTTGFGTADFDQWPLFSKSLLLIMMAIGGCAGSTAGGLKVIRIIVLFKHMARECGRLLIPNLVKPISVDKKAIDDSIIWGVMGFISLYILALVLCTVTMCALPHEVPANPINPVPEGDTWSMDLDTAASASLSALNSIGPGMANVGPVKNYAFVHPIGKYTLAFCMLLGRLEIYSLLILLLPTFWKRH
ncbi:MAG: TrkH family potassium uptake protein [Planctomycetota bacterium]